jgi:hypothetical protein
MRNLLFIPVAVAIVSCQSGQTEKVEKDIFSIDSVKAHILKMNESYSQRFTSNDTAYFNSRYCKDAQVYSPGMPAVVGRDSFIRTVRIQKQKLNCHQLLYMVIKNW